MAIDAYTGLPRSGKSYSVVKNVILPSLKEGREIYTNIPLTEKAHTEYPGQIHQLASDWFTDPDLCDTFPPGAVVILDELWRRWPAGLKANNVNFKDKEFLAEHGHNVSENGHTTRVVLVSQDLSQIAAFARDLVSVTYRSVKLDAVGADSRFRVDIYSGAVTGQNPPKIKLNRSTFDKYEPIYYDYYKSSTKSLTGNVGDESRADKRNNIWRSKFIIFSIAGPLILGPLLVWYVIGIFSSGFGLADPEPEPEPILTSQPGQVHHFPPPTPEPKPEPQPEPEPLTPVEYPLSTVWRVVGYMLDAELSDNKNNVILIASDLSGMRRVLASDCDLLPDGYQWQCYVDGTRVTPWSGRGEYSTWADSGSLVRRTSGAASGATSPRSPANLDQP